MDDHLMIDFLSAIALNNDRFTIRIKCCLSYFITLAINKILINAIMQVGLRDITGCWLTIKLED
ncbi:MAG TPA: hypothetical protein DEV89_04540, partial [Erysipelotrichaceae bacterium]|nr:hypothetical protein [Erysipelotrichaceae bacterium]